MVAAGALGEVGRHPDLGSAAPAAGRLREPEVVTHRQTETDAVDIGNDGRVPGETRADSVSTGPSSTDTSKRWILRYVAAIEPFGSSSTLVL